MSDVQASDVTNYFYRICSFEKQIFSKLSVNLLFVTILTQAGGVGQGPVPPGPDGHVQAARAPGQGEHRGQDRGPRV